MTLQLAGKEQLRTQGQRVRRARRTLELSQAELANRVSVHTGDLISHQTIYLIEKGKRDIWHREMTALVAILHRDASWLAGLTEDEWDRVKPGYRGKGVGPRTYPRIRPAT
jgi:transcriptional regulator with XRE-family HTH domain